MLPGSASAQTAPAPGEPASVATEESLTAADRVAAAMSARLSGKRVEVLSERTEESVTFVNPDGSFTSELSSGPVRVQDESGAWRDIDTTLVREGDEFVPRAAAADYGFSADGAGDFATLTGKDQRGRGVNLALTWGKRLPAPVADGDTLTYPNVIPGGDLTVTAGAAGFSHSLVLRQRPGSPMVLRIPAAVKGLTLSVTETGGLEARDVDGEVVYAAPQPRMWDSSEDPATGEPQRTAVVDARIDTSGKRPVLVLTPDAAMLADPATVYPVTIDPTFTKGAADTWVQTPDYTSSQTGSAELKVGTYDGGTHRARSYLTFDTASLIGTKINSATMRLHNFYSGSCTGAPIAVKRILTEWAGTLTWANQPSVTSADADTYTPAYGYSSSCSPNGNYASWDVTDPVQVWANGTPNYGLRLSAVDGTSSNTWRRYRSANYVDGAASVEPQLIVNYNSYPSTPSSLVMLPGQYAFYTPPTGARQLFATTKRPQFNTTVSDPDKTTVKSLIDVTQGSTLVWNKQPGATVGSGGVSLFTPASTASSLAENGTYTVKGWANDGSLTSKAGLSPWTFTVDTTPPKTVYAACPGITNGAWYTTAPAASTTCTLSAKGTASGTISPDVATYTFQVNNEPVVTKTVAPGSTTQVPLTLSNRKGPVRVVMTAKDRAGHVSVQSGFSFGIGAPSIAEPSADARSSSTFAVSATGPTGASGAVVQYKRASESDTAWTTASNLRLASSGSAWTGTVTAAAAGSALPRLIWDAAAQGIDAPALVETRVCFTYTGPTALPTQCSPTRRVELVPHAFGGNFPTTDAGPGQAALFTGELNVAVTDAAVPSYAGSLSVGRSHTSLSGPVAGPAGVFGPGWTADFTGPDAGAGDLTVTDNTASDGAFFLTNPEGVTAAFVHSTLLEVDDDEDVPVNVRAEGMYLPVGENSDSDNRLTLTGQTLTLTDGGGTKTQWLHQGNGAWLADRIIEPYVTGTTRYVRDDSGRVTRILAAAPDGVTCDPIATTLAKGCRALKVTYSTATSATSSVPGAYAGRVSQLAAEVWDPAAAAMVTKPIAQYAYDSNGRLAEAWDARLPDLKTTYTYEVVNPGGTSERTLLQSVTPAGKATLSLAYDSKQRVTTVEAKNGSGTALVNPTRIVYDVPLAVTASAPGVPDLTLATTSTWGQGTAADPANDVAEDASPAPRQATAVFGPDYYDFDNNQPRAWPPATAADWQYATLTYTNARGWTTNNAAFGAGQWQIDATVYNTADPDAETAAQNGLVPGGEGTVAWTISESNLATARAKSTPEQVRELARKLAEINYYEYADPADPAQGTRLKHTLGVSRDVVLDNGDPFYGGRTLTTTTYDEGAPDLSAGQLVPYGLETSTTTAVVRPDIDPTEDGVNLTAERLDARTSRTEYSPNVPGDGDGWAQRTPTRTITTLDSGAELVNRTRFDGEGKVFETTLPGGAVTGGAGSDAATTITTYYTAAANATYPHCGGKPEWAGLECRTGPKAQPAGTSMPITWTTAYTALLQPAKVVETDGGSAGADAPAQGVQRTTVTGYDTADRPTTSSIVSAVSGDTPVGAKTTSYDPATGEVRSVAVAATAAAPASVITTCTDLLGRTTYYGEDTTAADCATATSTTTYDRAGRVATSNDGRGTYTYGYDGTDLNGNIERRGLVTAMTVGGLPAGEPATFKAAYDADGALVRQQYPNGIAATWTRDAAGDEKALYYRRGTDPVTATVNGAEVVLDFSRAVDAYGRVRVNNQPASTQTYTYDRAGRLTDVTDAESDTCTTRAYGFDANSNRTQYASQAAAADAGCPSPPTTAAAFGPAEHTYDTADRITGPGYSYDTLGRTRTLPAGDVTGGQSLTVGYHANDMVATQSVGAGSAESVKAFALDSADRIHTVIDTFGGTQTKRITNRYTNAGDSPSVIDTVTSSGGIEAAAWARYITAPSGDLALIQDSTGAATIQLANMHGDITATIDNSTTTPTAGAYYEHTEYGLPRASNPDQPRYGWLGSKQRSTDSLSGLALMGVRLYNPITGRFLSLDPIAGGNPNSYTYPIDPINKYDPDGRAGIQIAKVISTTKRYGARHVIRYGSRKLGFGFEKACLKHGWCNTTGMNAVIRGGYIEQRQGTRVTYRGNVVWTGPRGEVLRRVSVRVVYDFGPAKNPAIRKVLGNKPIGLVTAYCVGMKVCPVDINRGIPLT
jgi:RHS repeat-associated protein